MVHSARIRLRVDPWAQVCPNGPPMLPGTNVGLTDVISVREASARTGIPKRRIYKWIKTGRVWSMTIGDRIMVHRSDVESWQSNGEWGKAS